MKLGEIAAVAALAAAPALSAQAQEPTTQPAPAAPDGQRQVPDYLHAAHLTALREQIGVLGAQITASRAQLAATQQAAQAGNPAAQAQVPDEAARIAALEADVEALEAQLADDAHGLLRLGLGVSARRVALNGQSDHPTQAEVTAFAGTNLVGPLGVEANLGAGVEATEGVAPFSASFGADGTLDLYNSNALNVTALAGGRLSLLQNVNGDGSHLLGTAGAAIRAEFEGFFLKLGADATVAGEKGHDNEFGVMPGIAVGGMTELGK